MPIQKASIAVGVSLAFITGSIAAAQEEEPFVPMAMALNADGSLLASSQLIARNGPGTVTTVTQTRTSKELYRITWKEHSTRTLAFSPGGRYLALGGGVHAKTTTFVGIVEMVAADTGRQILREENKVGMVWHLSFSFNGKNLLAYLNHTLEGPRAVILDSRTGERTQTLSLAQLSLDNQKGVIGDRVAFFHPDGRVLINPGLGRAKIYDIQTEKAVYSVTPRHVRAIRDVTFSPDSKLAIVVQQTSFSGPGEMGVIERQGVVHVLDAKTGNEVRTIEGHRKQILCTAMSPDGRLLATGSMDRTAKVWDVQTGKEIATFAGHKRRVLAFAFANRGREIVSTSADGVVRIWNCQTGKEITPITPDMP